MGWEYQDQYQKLIKEIEAHNGEWICVQQQPPHTDGAELYFMLTDHNTPQAVIYDVGY